VMNMKISIIALLLVGISAPRVFAQAPSPEQEIVSLSAAKWQWMADKNVDALAGLFHDKAKFVHMGGTWGRAQELEIIRSGGIHYKQATVHDVVADVVDDTAVLWSRITLVAALGTNEVTTEFTVTEVYKKQANAWKMLALTFSSVRPEATIAR
jgi:hypothetical protein